MCRVDAKGHLNGKAGSGGTLEPSKVRRVGSPPGMRGRGGSAPSKVWGRREMMGSLRLSQVS